VRRPPPRAVLANEARSRGGGPEQHQGSAEADSPPAAPGPQQAAFAGGLVAALGAEARAIGGGIEAPRAPPPAAGAVADEPPADEPCRGGGEHRGEDPCRNGHGGTIPDPTLARGKKVWLQGWPGGVMLAGDGDGTPFDSLELTLTSDP